MLGNDNGSNHVLAETAMAWTSLSCSSSACSTSYTPVSPSPYTSTPSCSSLSSSSIRSYQFPPPASSLYASSRKTPPAVPLTPEDQHCTNLIETFFKQLSSLATQLHHDSRKLARVVALPPLSSPSHTSHSGTSPSSTVSTTPSQSSPPTPPAVYTNAALQRLEEKATKAEQVFFELRGLAAELRPEVPLPELVESVHGLYRVNEALIMDTVAAMKAMGHPVNVDLLAPELPALPLATDTPAGGFTSSSSHPATLLSSVHSSLAHSLTHSVPASLSSAATSYTTALAPSALDTAASVSVNSSVPLFGSSPCLLPKLPSPSSPVASSGTLPFCSPPPPLSYHPSPQLGSTLNSWQRLQSSANYNTNISSLSPCASSFANPIAFPSEGNLGASLPAPIAELAVTSTSGVPSSLSISSSPGAGGTVAVWSYADLGISDSTLALFAETAD
eukprot:GHVQ01041278.1.p1 GENE.GHVQ01041278.1~~GHVQ01041278.1.p1  ORF type:complete len:446 (+),score=92.52 GHVQ01041278.1:321-1658(+)